MRTRTKEPETAANEAMPVCTTCNGHGLIGGLVPWGDGEVDSICEPCPDCASIPSVEAK